MRLEQPKCGYSDCDQKSSETLVMCRKYCNFHFVKKPKMVISEVRALLFFSGYI